MVQAVVQVIRSVVRSSYAVQTGGKRFFLNACTLLPLNRNQKCFYITIYVEKSGYILKPEGGTLLLYRNLI